MNDIFTNKIGTENLARNFFALNASIPQDRYIDKEYKEVISRTLSTEKEDECKPNQSPKN